MWIMLVGMARAFGTVGHACATKCVKCEKEGKVHIERVQECVRVFEQHRTRRYGRFSRRPCALFALLGAAALSCTHRSRRGLHSVEAAFTLCLVLPFHTRLLRSSLFLAPITTFAI